MNLVEKLKGLGKEGMEGRFGEEKGRGGCVNGKFVLQ
jgi:hypothetical protein